MGKISFVLEELDDEYTDSDEDYGWFVALDVDEVVENKFDTITPCEVTGSKTYQEQNNQYICQKTWNKLKQCLEIL